ncbi:MAG: KEOPS complex subunit Pcc1 [Nanobdellota archaeon]
MRYALSLKISAEDSKNIKELIEADGLNFGKRCKASIEQKKNSLEAKFESEDATSLRAGVNGILKVLQIYEKSGSV